MTNTPDVEKLEAKIAKLEAQINDTQTYIITLKVVQEVTRSLTSELNLDPLLRKIVAAAVKVTDAAAGSLLLVDQLTGELIFTVVEGGAGEDLQGVRIAGDAGLAGWVATHREPLIIDDVNKDHRHYQSIAEIFSMRFTSLLCVPMITHNKVVGVLQIVRNLSNHYFGVLEKNLLTTFASEAGLAIENARLYESLKGERDKLVVVEDDVRKRLARDLHDGPTQFISAMLMSFELIEEMLKDSSVDEAFEEINHTKSLASETLKQLRTLLFNLRPIILETQGLIPALEMYVERLQETDNLNINLTIDGELDRFHSNAEVAIFAVIQEAVNNAKKYAGASTINLSFSVNQKLDTVTVSIKDRGVGFEVRSVTQGYDKSGSLGLINMQERISAINGTFKISSAVGQGTEVLLTLPLKENYLNKNN